MVPLVRCQGQIDFFGWLVRFVFCCGFVWLVCLFILEAVIKVFPITNHLKPSFFWNMILLLFLSSVVIIFEFGNWLLTSSHLPASF